MVCGAAFTHWGARHREIDRAITILHEHAERISLREQKIERFFVKACSVQADEIKKGMERKKEIKM